MSKKRVLFLSQFYPPDLGAASGRSQAHCRALTRNGNEVTVLSPMASYPVGQLSSADRRRLWVRSEDKGVRLIRYRPIFVGIKKLPIRIMAETWASIVTFVGGMVLALRSDVVIATSPSPFLGVTGALLKWLMPRKRYVWEVRDLTWQYAFELGKVRGRRIQALTNSVVRWMARTADSIVVTNPVQARYFADMGLPAERIRVVYNGVTEDEFPDDIVLGEDDSAEMAVTYVGLIGFAQGLGTLLEVAGLAQKDGLPMRFHLVGDGAELSLIRNRAVELGLENVTFHGACPRPELQQHYREADVLFAQLRDVPVFSSALPSKLLEYMYSGRPVVFAGRGPGAELVEQARGGVVTTPENPNAIYGALKKLYGVGGQERSRIGHRGREFVKQYFLRQKTTATFVAVVEGN